MTLPQPPLRSPRHLGPVAPGLLLALAAGCYATPDAGPFADSTSELRAAITVAGDAVLDRLTRDAISKDRYEPLREAWDRRDRILDAMARYSDTLATVAANEFEGFPGDRIADAFVRLQREALATPATPPDRRRIRSNARVIARARRQWSADAAARDLQPLLDALVDELEVDLKTLDAELAHAEDELAATLRESDDYQGLDAHRDRLRAFLRSTDVADASLEDVLKASNVATMLNTSQALVTARDTELAALRRRIDTIRDLARETRVALRTWAIAHSRVASAMAAGRPVAVEQLRSASARIHELVAALRQP